MRFIPTLLIMLFIFSPILYIIGPVFIGKANLYTWVAVHCEVIYNGIYQHEEQYIEFEYIYHYQGIEHIGLEFDFMEGESVHSADLDELKNLQSQYFVGK